MSEPTPYPKEQVRQQLISQMRNLARYWANIHPNDALEACEGTVFSILNILDGNTLPLPHVDLILAPHPDDKQYAKDAGHSHYFKPGMVINDDCQLHDIFSFSKELKESIPAFSPAIYSD